MSSTFQTIAALVVVAAAAAWLLWRAASKRHHSGCGGHDCGVLSPDAKALLKRPKQK
jgi:hypothetical protein